MMTARTTGRWLHWAICGLGMVASLNAIGCQTNVGGQTLPSAYYLQDDVQYFPPGPEFRLSREAAALREYRAERELEQATP